MEINQEYVDFLSDFVNGLNIHDQLPVPVSSYNIDNDELVGDFVHWLLQYLYQKHCPLGLVAPLVRAVVDDMLGVCRNSPEANTLRDNSGQFAQLRLMQACTARVNALCVRLHQDPALLAPPFLSPPPPRPVPVASHGVRSSQRRGMEDRHVVVHDFNSVFNVQDDTLASYYAVFDGHAGPDAAVYSAAHVHQFLAESRYYPADPVKALKEAILRTDEHYLKKVTSESRYQSGTTALCALLRGRMLHVAWVGDSQAVLVRNGKAELLVDPHKPNRPDEERRITEQGGLVLYHGIWRVNGQLAVSRAIGDLNFKPYVSADAEVRSVPLEADHELLILASDGLFDFVGPQQAASTVFQQLQDNPDNIHAVCSRLINLAKQQGSTDDISVIVAFLTEPRELAKRPTPPAWNMDDLVDTSATHVNGGSNNPWANPFHMQEQSGDPADAMAKKALNMDLNSLDPPVVQPTKQNGSGFLHHSLHHQHLYDMGPETDVDRIDESDDDETGSQDGAGRHSNPFMPDARHAEEDEEVELRRIQQQQPEFDAARHPREETPTPPADQVPVAENVSSGIAADVDNVVDSGDESEEEWKYFSVEPTKPTSESRQTFDDEILPSQQQDIASSEQEEQELVPSSGDKTTDILDFESQQSLEPTAPVLLQSLDTHSLFLAETETGEENNMDSQLNPNAAEFVPVSPTNETCQLPDELNAVVRSPVQSPIDNLGFDMDAAAPVENVPVFSAGSFEHHPMDFLHQDELLGEKENLVLQEATIPDLVPSPMTEQVLEAEPSFTEGLDNLHQYDSNTLEFCGTPPIAICEPCAPLTTETVEEVENSHFEGNSQTFEHEMIQTFEHEMIQRENMDMFSANVPLPEPTVEAVISSEVNTTSETLASPEPTHVFETDPKPPLSPQSTALSPEPTLPPHAAFSPEPTLSPQAALSPEPPLSSQTAFSPEPPLSPQTAFSPEPPLSPQAVHSPEPAVEPEPVTAPETECVNVLETESVTAPETEFIETEPIVAQVEPLETEPVTAPETEYLETEPITAPETEPLETESVTTLETEVFNVYDHDVQYTQELTTTEKRLGEEKDMFMEEKDMFVEQTSTDVLVETPNFSVAQGPTFPVVENIVTPDEESAATGSPALEESPLIAEVKPPVSDVQEENLSAFHSQENQLPVSPIPMSPQIAVCPAFPCELETSVPSVDDTLDVIESESSRQDVLALSTPVLDDAVTDELPAASSPGDLKILLQHDEPILEAVSSVTATPPSTPAAMDDVLIDTKEDHEEGLMPENVEDINQSIEKLASQPEVESVETSPEHHIKEVLAAAAVTATAVGATAAVMAAKSSKSSSQTKAETPATKKTASPSKDKPSSPTKEKPSSPIKKTTVAPTSKTAPKPSPTKTAPAAKTTSTATKPAAAKSSPLATKPSVAAPRAAPPAARKTASSALTAAPKSKPTGTTAPPKPAKPTVSGTLSPTKTTAAKSSPATKPAVSAPSKTPTEAKKPLTNGDVAKPAPRRPVSATTSTTTTKGAPKPASSTAKPSTGVAPKPAAPITVTKAPPKPRPASAAVNGVAKPKAEVATKTSRPVSATSGAASSTAIKRAPLPTKPVTAVKQEKETANKQLSATTRTSVTKTTTVTKTSTMSKSTPPGKVPPTKKPTSGSVAKTKSPLKTPDAAVQVNGNDHTGITYGKDALLEDTPQQDLLIETSAPCLVSIDGTED